MSNKFKEIERKFLIDINKIELEGLVPKKIKQGYMFNTDSGIARIRQQDEQFFITFKTSNIDISRTEVEIEIKKDEAQVLFNEFCSSIIEKERYNIEIDGKTWEIDLFKGNNEGLIIAEIELSSIREKVRLPEWIIKEVSTDQKYFNNNLIKKPFKEWNKTKGIELSCY